MPAKPLRIGFDAKRLFNNWSGLGHYSRTLLFNLQKFFPEYEYHLYTPGITINEHTEYFLDSSKFQIHLPHNLMSKLYWRQILISKYLLRDKIHIFHGLSHEIPWRQHIFRCKFVVTFHDLMPFILPADFNLVDRFIAKKKISNALTHAHKVICVSRNTRDLILKKYPNVKSGLEVIPQCTSEIYYRGIEDSISEPELRIQKPYFLFVGAAKKRKNLPTVLKAMDHMKTSSEGFYLVVTGEVGGRLKVSYQRLLNKLKLIDRVIFIGNISQSQLLHFYRNAIALIYPSHYEGFGLPVLEALLLGIRVICSAKGALSEFYSDNISHLNDETNYLELADYMFECLKNTNQTFEKFEGSNPKDMADRYMKIYIQLATRNDHS